MLWAVPFGLLIGISLGALGGGGSILTVPVLVYLLGQDPSTATTTSLVVVGITALTGALSHYRGGRVRLGQGVTFGLMGVGGAWLGSRLSGAVRPEVLLALFAVLIVVVAVLMFRRARRGPASAPALGSAIGARPAPDVAFLTLRPTFMCNCPRALRVLITATAAGLLTGFFGVGGGFAVVPALVIALGFSMPVAVGTSLVVIAINSAAALTARLSSGLHIDLAVVGVFTAAAIGGSLLGGRVAARVQPRHLTLAFATLLLVVAAYTGIRSLPALF